MKFFLSIITNDLKLAIKRGGGTASLLAFFVISSTLFPFGIGSEPEILARTGSAIIWVCAIFSSMLAMPKLFDDDYEDGTLAQYILTGNMPQILVLAKITSHWLANMLPLIIITPIICVFFSIEKQIFPLVISLIAGTPALVAIGAIAASLTIGLKRGGGLLAILVFPLYIPVLIFGVSAANADSSLFLSCVMILVALLLFMLPVSLYATATAIKTALDE